MQEEACAPNPPQDAPLIIRRNPKRGVFIDMNSNVYVYVNSWNFQKVQLSNYYRQPRSQSGFETQVTENY